MLEVTPAVREEIERGIRDEGFLSPWIERLIPQYGRPYQQWIDYARELNRVVQKVWYDNDEIIVGRGSLDPVSISGRLILPALSAFQGAVILAERGMLTESYTLTRGVYETGFWLGFLAKEPTKAKEALLGDERKSQISMAKLLKNDDLSASDLALLDSRIAELSRGNVKLSIKDVAARSGFESWYRAYKRLSAEATHASLQSLHRHVNTDGSGGYIGHVFGPDIEGIGQALETACDGAQLCAAAFRAAIGGTPQDDQLHSLFLRFKEMCR